MAQITTEEAKGSNITWITSDLDPSKLEVENKLTEAEEKLITMENNLSDSHKNMLNRCRSMKMCFMMESALVNFEFANEEGRSFHYDLNLGMDYASGNKVIQLGGFIATKEDLLNLVNKYDQLVSNTDVMVKVNQAIADRIANRKKELEDAKQLRLIEFENENKEIVWLSSIVVETYLFHVPSNKLKQFKIFVKAYTNFVDDIDYKISFNGKATYNKFDLMMLYSKFDAMFNKTFGESK